LLVEHFWQIKAHEHGALPETMRTPSHVYAAIIRDAIKRHVLVDNLHLSDVLMRESISLRNGCQITTAYFHLQFD
jgi:hypothetical protein